MAYLLLDFLNHHHEAVSLDKDGNAIEQFQVDFENNVINFYLGQDYAKDNEIFLIGSNSKFINIKKFNNNHSLPLVFGKFTAEKFVSFKKILSKSNLNYSDIKEIFFYPSGRIDIKNIDNVTIKFPKENLDEAISIASKIINNKNLKNNVIDLRIKNHLILSNE